MGEGEGRTGKELVVLLACVPLRARRSEERGSSGSAAGFRPSLRRPTKSPRARSANRKEPEPVAKKCCRLVVHSSVREKCGQDRAAFTLLKLHLLLTQTMPRVEKGRSPQSTAQGVAPAAQRRASLTARPAAQPSLRRNPAAPLLQPLPKRFPDWFVYMYVFVT